jgi:ABC-type taurine transport system ATPase subunit
MNGLLLDGLPGLPRRLELELGERRALVVRDAAAVRRLADLVAGLEERPPGAVVKASDPIRLVPVEGGLLPHLTVLGNVVHGHVVSHRVPRRAVEDECRQAASKCGLEDVLERYPHEITPGRRRLTGVARALAAAPAAVVLEDAPGLPTWGSLLSFPYAALSRPVLLLITTDAARTAGFTYDD